jgi:glutamine phosphoribosylpyrophosphate amidotransferase
MPNLLKDLFLFSESRGKEASGIAVCSREKIQVLKSAVAASSMIRTTQYRQLMAETVHGTDEKLQEPIGHSRLVTDGSRYDQGNNQPVLPGNCVAIHNGIIINSEEIWKQQSGSPASISGRFRSNSGPAQEISARTRIYHQGCSKDLCGDPGNSIHRCAV